VGKNGKNNIKQQEVQIVEKNNGRKRGERIPERGKKMNTQKITKTSD